MLEAYIVKKRKENAFSIFLTVPENNIHITKK